MDVVMGGGGSGSDCSLFMLCRQHRPYSRSELFGFYSSIAFTHCNQFMSVDTSEFKKLTDILIYVQGKYQIEPKVINC